MNEVQYMRNPTKRAQKMKCVTRTAWSQESLWEYLLVMLRMLLVMAQQAQDSP